MAVFTLWLCQLENIHVSTKVFFLTNVAVQEKLCGVALVSKLPFRILAL